MIIGRSCIANRWRIEIILGHHKLLFGPRSDEKERALASNGMHFCLGCRNVKDGVALRCTVQNEYIYIYICGTSHRTCLTFRLNLQPNPRFHVHDAERELHQAGHCGSHVLPFLVPHWVTCIEQILALNWGKRAIRRSEFWAGANYALPKLSERLRWPQVIASILLVLGKLWKVPRVTQTTLHCKDTRLSFFNICMGIINVQRLNNKSGKNIL